MTTEQAESLPATHPGRGRTVISDRVRQRLIEHAVLSVPGVVRRRAIVPGRTLPAVHVDGGPRSRVVEVEVATNWPVDGPNLLTGVEGAVQQELLHSLAELPQRVDVRITRIDSDRTPAEVADAYANDTVGAMPAGASDHRYGPRRIAGSTITGLVVALAVTAAGVIAVRDALIAASWLDSAAWIEPAVGWVAHSQWQWWTWPLAVVAALVGLALLVISIKPRRRAYLPVGDGVWIPRHAADTWRDRPPSGPDSEGVDR